MSQATLPGVPEVPVVVQAKPGPWEIVGRAFALYRPIAWYACYSGGNDSLAAVHWAMTNLPNCKVLHINTGIGIERTRAHVRETCKRYGWPLTEIRAKEDCGMDYDEIVLKNGFPGPNQHTRMYIQLKERCIALLLRRVKKGKSRMAKVMLVSGARYDESKRRMMYAGKEINPHGGQLWVNPFYWTSEADRNAYIAMHQLPVNPVTVELGMSGECGCGSYAHDGEFEIWDAVDPRGFGDRIRRLRQQCLERGFTWDWDGEPPRGGHNDAQEVFLPLCGASCYKSAIVRKELEEQPA